MVEITFRMAKATDSAALLAWRNDPESMQNSVHQEVIKDEDHAAWMSKIVGSTDNILLIAEIDGVAVGAFRMDKFTIAESGLDVPDVRLISYIVAPGLRKQGIGRAIVAEGCVCYGQEYSLIAKIRNENVASRKILESCDFILMGEVEEGISAYVRPSNKEDIIQ